MKKESLVQALRGIKGNAKACVLTEPLWGIPSGLFTPFATVYMVALGVTDQQIGMIASIVLLIRALSASVSGVITDKLGRRFTVALLDLIAWSVPLLLWTVAQNFWWFLVSASINALWQVADNAWTCLMVEDAEPRQLVDIYNWIYVAVQLAVFFAPIAGLLVNGLGLVTAVRIIYGFSFVCMTVKWLLLYRFSTETATGVVRKRETKGKPFFAVLSEYRALIPKFLRSEALLSATAVSVLFIAVNLIMDSFFGIYTTKELLVPEQYLALFPIIRSAIMLTFLFLIQPRIARFGYRGPMLLGVCLYIASHLCLILLPGVTPTGSLVAPVAYALLQASASALVMPRKDSFVATCLNGQERARMNSLLTVVILAVTIPFGYIAGLLSGVNRALPFVLNIALFAVAFAVIATLKRLKKAE